MLPLIGGLLSAGASLFGASKAADNAAAQRAASARANELNIEYQDRWNQMNRDAVSASNAILQADKEQDRALQREFAQSGVQWRVKDAQAAGIHPLAAIGMQGASYSPSPLQVGTFQGQAPTVQPEFGQDDSPRYLAAAGQDIGRAIQATRTAMDRDVAFDTTSKALSLQKMGLENELLASQIQRLKVNANPSFPSTRKSVSVQLGGRDYGIGPLGLKKDPGTSDMQDISDRIGEEGPGAWLAGAAILWRDLMHTYGSKGVGEILGAVDRNTKVFGK